MLIWLSWDEIVRDNLVNVYQLKFVLTVWYHLQRDVRHELQVWGNGSPMQNGYKEIES